MRLPLRFERKALPTAETTAARFSGLPAYQQGNPYRAGWDLERAIRDGLERVIWVWRAVDAICSNQIRLPIRIRKDDPATGVDLDAHPLVPILNAYPNQWEDAGTFRYRLSAQFLLSPRGVFVEITRTNAGGVAGLTLLPPQYTSPVPDPVSFVKEFRVELPGYPPVNLPPSDVVWIRRPHPTDPYRSLTPLEAAGLSIDNDFYARLYNRRFLQSDARPSTLVAVAGDMGDDAAKELRAKIEAGGPGSLAIIDNAGTTTIKDLATSPHDMQFIQLGQKSKEEILVSFGVPESTAGDSSKRTFDNAQTEKQNFWSETMEAHCGFIARPFDRIDGDPSTFVVFDFSSIGVLQKDRIEREAHLLELVSHFVITPEEAREESGREPSGDPDLDKFYAPLTLVPIGARVPAAPPQDDPAPVSVGSLQPPRTVMRPKATGGFTELKQRREAQLQRWERRVHDEMKSFFSRQRKVVLAKLGGPKTRRGTRHWTPLAAGAVAVKAIEADDVFNVDDWNSQLRDLASGLVKDIFQEYGDDVAASLDATFNIASPRVTAAILAQTNRLVGVNDTTYQAIKQALAQGEAAGATISQLADAIASVFGDAEGYRATMIARTETLGAANGASYTAAADAGASTKMWLSAEDDRVRGTRPSDEFDHVAADGEEVAIDQPFVNTGENMDYPGDPNGSAANVVNCRCALSFAAGITE